DREQLLAEEHAASSHHDDHHETGEGDDGPESAMDRALDQEVPEEPARNGESSDKRANGNGESNGNGNGNDIEEIASEHSVDTLGGDEDDEVARRRAHFLRKYK